MKARGHAVVEISRGQGIDLITGQGLPQALEGADVAIDVSNPVPTNQWSDGTETLTTAARNLVRACAAQGVGRLVVSTLACIDDPAFDGVPYYEARRAAKELVLAGPVPTTIIRSTQWYEFATNPAAVSCNSDEVMVEDWLIQPIAADTVADVLVEAALGQTHPPRTVTGPQAMRLPELTSKVLARQGDHRRVRAVRPAVTALATGALLANGQAMVLGPDVDTWLRTLPPARTVGSRVEPAAKTPPAGVSCRG